MADSMQSSVIVRALLEVEDGESAARCYELEDEESTARSAVVALQRSEHGEVSQRSAPCAEQATGSAGPCEESVSFAEPFSMTEEPAAAIVVVSEEPRMAPAARTESYETGFDAEDPGDDAALRGRRRREHTASVTFNTSPASLPPHHNHHDHRSSAVLGGSDSRSSSRAGSLLQTHGSFFGGATRGFGRNAQPLVAEQPGGLPRTTSGKHWGYIPPPAKLVWALVAPDPATPHDGNEATVSSAANRAARCVCVPTKGRQAPSVFWSAEVVASTEGGSDVVVVQHHCRTAAVGDTGVSLSEWSVVEEEASSAESGATQRCWGLFSDAEREGTESATAVCTSPVPPGLLPAKPFLVAPVSHSRWEGAAINSSGDCFAFFGVATATAAGPIGVAPIVRGLGPVRCGDANADVSGELGAPPPMKLMASWFGYALCGDDAQRRCFVTGGFRRLPASSGAVEFSRLVYRWDPLQGRATTIDARSVKVPPGLAHHATVFYNGSLLLIGGFVQGQLLRSRPSSAATPQPTGIIVAVSDNCDADATIVKPSAFGGDSLDQSVGLNSSGMAGDRSSDPLLVGNGVYAFDVASASWSHVKCVGDVPEGRASHGAVLVDEWVFVVGGIGDGGVARNDVYALHARLHLWVRIDQGGPGSLLPACPAPHAFIVSVSAASDPHSSPSPSSSSATPSTPPLATAVGATSLGVRTARGAVAATPLEALLHAAGVRKELVCARLGTLGGAGERAGAVRSQRQIDATVARLFYESDAPMAMQDPRVQRLARVTARVRKSVLLAERSKLRTVTQEGAAQAATMERLFDPRSEERRLARVLAALAARGPPRKAAVATPDGLSAYGPGRLRTEALVRRFYTEPLRLQEMAAQRRLNALDEAWRKAHALKPELRESAAGVHARLASTAEATRKREALLAKHGALAPSRADAKEIGEARSATPGPGVLPILKRFAEQDERSQSERRGLADRYLGALRGTPHLE